MDIELAERWLANLESGEFEQGIGKLRADGKFCCLGVLCEAAGASWELDSERKFRPVLADIHNMDNTLLTKPIREFVGLDRHLHKLCWTMNDGGNDHTLIRAAGLEPSREVYL